MAGQMWRAVAVFRVVTLAYAAALIVRNHGHYDHPVGGLVALAAMAVWTTVTVACYAVPAGRRRSLLVADVAVAVALVVATRWVDTTTRVEHGAPTLPVSWAAAAVLACAVAGGAWGGLAAATAVSAADLVERQALPQPTFNAIVLLVVAGVVVGYAVRLGIAAEVAVERSARLQAATAERDRIARNVHDSVLQVLALLTRRGRELGGEAGELGRLAGEQEAALRALLASTTAVPPAGQLDLRQLVDAFATERVSVSCPADPVLLPDQVAYALTAATREALSNVQHHAGAAARAWVLVEDEGRTVAVSVRDDGCGFERSRLTQAAASGRLGVAASIVGRLQDVGGAANVTSAPARGTEVELRVPRR